MVLNGTNEIRVANLEFYPLNLVGEIAAGACLGNFIGEKMKFWIKGVTPIYSLTFKKIFVIFYFFIRNAKYL